MVTPARDRPGIAAFRTLLRAHREVIEAHKRTVPELSGLSLVEFDILATLGNQEGMRMGEIARVALVSPANVTWVASALERRGLLRRRRSPESDRVVLASLTRKGQALFERTFEPVVAYTESLFEGLSVNEQRELARLLSRVVATQPGPSD